MAHYLPYAIFPVSLMLIFGGAQRNGHMTAFLITACVVLAAYIKDHLVRAYYLWALILGAGAYGTIIAMQTNVSLRMHMSAMDSFVKLSAAMVIFITAARIPERRWQTVANILCAFVLFQCAVYGLQLNGYDLVRYMTILIDATYRPMAPAGTLGNPNFLAACIAIVLPFFFRGIWHIALILLVPVLVMQRTSGAIVAVGCGVGYLFIKSEFPRWIKMVGFGVMVITAEVFFIYFDPPEFDRIRRILWMQVIHTWPVWWLFGLGIGSYTVFSTVEHVHNEFLEVGFEGGFVHVAILFLLCGRLIKDAIKATNPFMVRLCGSLIILTVLCVFHYPLHLAPSGFISLVLLGIYSNGRLSYI